MPAAAPWQAYIEQLRALAGEPRITYQAGDTNYPITERVMRYPIGETLPAMGSAEPDATRFANNTLVDRQTVSEDGHFVEVYLRYERLAGQTLISEYWDMERGQKVAVYEQPVAYGTDPETDVGVISSAVQAVNAQKSTRRTERAVSTAIPGGATRDDVWFTEQDERTLADIYHVTRWVAAGTALPAVGTTITVGGAGSAGAGLYIHSRKRKKLSDTEDVWTIEASAVPDAFSEYVSTGIRFPGIFEWLQTSITLSDSNWYPRPGIDYTYLKPRTNLMPARATHYFTVGEPESIPKRFVVITPGTACRRLSISEDTVHGQILWYADIDGTLTLVENIPPSDPASYNPMDLYTFDVDVRRWRGSIYETVITEASEGKVLHLFDPPEQGTSFKIGPFSSLARNVDYGDTGFFAVNTNSGANEVRLFGYLGSTWTKLSGTLPADGGLVDLRTITQPSGGSMATETVADGEPVLNTVEFITGDGTAHADGVAVYTYGTAGSATITFGSNPSNGNTLQLGFANGVASYSTTYTFKSALTESALASGTLTLTGNAIDGETVTITALEAPQSKTYTWRDTLTENIQATGEWGLTANPSAGNTVTLGSTVYTFRAALTGVANEVLIGATISDTLDNLEAAINGAAGSGTTYGLGTLQNTDATGEHIDPTVTVTSTGSVGRSTSMAVVNGRPGIAYHDATNAAAYFARAPGADGSGTWTVAATTLPNAEVLSLCMVNGYPAIAAIDTATGNVNFSRSATLDGSSSWGAAVEVNGDGYGTGINGISMAIVDGRPAIAFQDNTNDYLRFVRASDANGAAWPSNTTVDNAGTVEGGVSLAVINGYPCIAYQRATTLYFASNDEADGSGTWTIVAVDTSVANTGGYPSLAEVNDRPAIAYHNGTDGELNYIRALDSEGAAWPAGGGTTVDASTAIMGRHPSLVVVNGYPAIAYRDETNDDLLYIRASDANGDVWPAAPGTTLDSTGDVGQYASMVVVNGSPAVAYFDDTNDDVKFIRAGDEDGAGWNGYLKATAIAAGTSGNSVFTSTTGTGLSWSGASLSGGAAAVVNEVQIGASASASLDNLIAAINGTGTAGTEYSTGTAENAVIDAAAGAGDTMDVSSVTTGTASNGIGTTEAMSAGSWGAATLSGGLASVANEVKIGAAKEDTALNLQRAINATTGYGGTSYSSATTANTIIEVPTLTSGAAAFTVQTVLAADWESFDSLSGGNFNWRDGVTGSVTVGNISGAANGDLLGTLDDGTHSVVCNAEGFDDPNLAFHNFPPAFDDITTNAVHVGQRAAYLYWGGWGGMPLKYQVSVNGSSSWVDGAEALEDAKDGTIRKQAIADCDWNGSTPAGQRYEYVRFVVSPAESAAPNRPWGEGDVSRLYLAVTWSI